MNVFEETAKQLLQALTANAEKETMDYILQEMQAVLGEEMPEEDAMRTYLQDPDGSTALSTEQQLVAIPGFYAMPITPQSWATPTAPASRLWTVHALPSGWQSAKRP